MINMAVAGEHGRTSGVLIHMRRRLACSLHFSALIQTYATSHASELPVLEEKEDKCQTISNGRSSADISLISPRTLNGRDELVPESPIAGHERGNGFLSAAGSDAILTGDNGAAAPRPVPRNAQDKVKVNTGPRLKSRIRLEPGSTRFSSKPASKSRTAPESRSWRATWSVDVKIEIPFDAHANGVSGVS
ncbi:hypothetical protein EVAR_4415_1 [Eumeta japonica]|uniref:Uncharacterized protein n=1 Tax=Eumeta variegata TaxID=151549 RepID=A0A4C1T148_EUMVA|nr:hypothetical protein EVAR_4415_1 [Eumeta japonica]